MVYYIHPNATWNDNIVQNLLKMNNCWSIGLEDSTNNRNQKVNDIYYQEWLVEPPGLWLKNDRCKHQEGKTLLFPCKFFWLYKVMVIVGKLFWLQHDLLT